jgi:hypothetical protein
MPDHAYGSSDPQDRGADGECSWIIPFLDYLNRGILSEDPTEADARQKAIRSLRDNCTDRAPWGPPHVSPC